MQDFSFMKSDIKQTYEGAQAPILSYEEQLIRSVMSCMLWESGFYESGITIAERIASLIPKVPAETVSSIAIKARNEMNLRHIPLFIVREMARHKSHSYLVNETLLKIIKRADDISVFMGLYWKEGKCSISSQVKKALAQTFSKFDEYQIAKYCNKKGSVKLRDVLFMVHPKPKPIMAEVFKRLADRTLKSQNTWETLLSQGLDKKEVWTKLLKEQKLGTLALIRNLRNMEDNGTDRQLIINSLENADVSDILPFRFIIAAQCCPSFKKELEQMLFRTLKSSSKIKGSTVLMLDVSGSMFSALSLKSYMTRFDICASLAVLFAEFCEKLTLYTFSKEVVKIEKARGFELFDKIRSSQAHDETFMGKALEFVNSNEQYDRVIIISDEQSNDTVSSPKALGYMINIAPYKTGLGYGDWIHIDGFSASVCDYIREYESLK